MSEWEFIEQLEVPASWLKPEMPSLDEVLNQEFPERARNALDVLEKIEPNAALEFGLVALRAKRGDILSSLQFLPCSSKPGVEYGSDEHITASFEAFDNLVPALLQGVQGVIDGFRFETIEPTEFPYTEIPALRMGQKEILFYHKSLLSSNLIQALKASLESIDVYAGTCWRKDGTSVAFTIPPGATPPSRKDRIHLLQAIFFSYPMCCYKAWVKNEDIGTLPATGHCWCKPNCKQSLELQQRYKAVTKKFFPELIDTLMEDGSV